MRDTVTLERTDTIYRKDTLKITKFQPKIIKIQSTDTLYKRNGDEVILKKERKIYDSTLIKNKDTLGVRAYVSGIDASLDSLEFSLSRKEIIREREVTIHKKPSRWSIGVIGGYGYGFRSRELEPFIGVGVSFRLY